MLATIIVTAPASMVVYTANLGINIVPPSAFLWLGYGASAGMVDALDDFTLGSALTVNANSFASSPPPIVFTSIGIYADTLSVARALVPR